jgi:hypothetical protein
VRELEDVIGWWEDQLNGPSSGRVAYARRRQLRRSVCVCGEVLLAHAPERPFAINAVPRLTEVHEGKASAATVHAP